MKNALAVATGGTALSRAPTTYQWTRYYIPMAWAPSGGLTDACLCVAVAQGNETAKKLQIELDLQNKEGGIQSRGNITCGRLFRGCSDIPCLDIRETGFGTRHVSQTKTFYQFSYCLPLIFILFSSWKQDIFGKKYNKNRWYSIPHILCVGRGFSNSIKMYQRLRRLKI